MSRPHCGHVFQTTETIFELVQDIIRSNVQTKFHEDWTINVTLRVLTRKNALPPNGNVFQPTGSYFELFQYFVGTTILTTLHKDRTIRVASSVLTRQMFTPQYGQITKAHYEHIVLS
ncbi:hypothetical protein DPMN_149533 [Dreissena polymorpha]|uniref:Uncharacterized protein n=1 Tax=Dreissena polymorpha TaxID=45954 RepID=A0A9D4FBX5_DREPO|nr:hypothetical protein DPMN_149533 [Dreissena polymorpha]